VHVADAADDGVLLSVGAMGREAFRLHAFDDFVDLLGRRLRRHDDHHSIRLLTRAFWARAYTLRQPVILATGGGARPPAFVAFKGYKAPHAGFWGRAYTLRQPVILATGGGARPPAFVALKGARAGTYTSSSSTSPARSMMNLKRALASLPMSSFRTRS